MKEVKIYTRKVSGYRGIHFGGLDRSSAYILFSFHWISIYPEGHDVWLTFRQHCLTYLAICHTDHRLISLVAGRGRRCGPGGAPRNYTNQAGRGWESQLQTGRYSRGPEGASKLAERRRGYMQMNDRARQNACLAILRLCAYKFLILSYIPKPLIFLLKPFYWFFDSLISECRKSRTKINMPSSQIIRDYTISLWSRWLYLWIPNIPHVPHYAQILFLYFTLLFARYS
jgi:hypothetical protein